MSMTITEEFYNSSEVNVHMNLFEVVPRVPNATTIIGCWKNALLEMAPALQGESIIFHN